MTTVVQNPTSDSYVVQASPSFNNGSSRYLTVTGSGASAARYSFIYFNRPFPRGVTVLSATLRLYQHGVAAGGSRVLSAKRVVTGWKESKITWANKPSTTATSASSASQGNGGTDGRVWEIDITAHMQEVSDGAAWYGLRITSDNDTQLTIFSSEADDFQPQIELEWSDAPETPEVLSPSNGRAVSVARPTLRFDFTDVSGDLTMSGYRLLMNEGAADPVSPDYDSGDVSTTLPQHLVTFDIAAAEDWWWAVETIDGAGLRSGLSDWVNFTRTAKPTVVIDSPTGGTVTDGTPPILWTVTGSTQTAFQVFLTDPTDTAAVLWSSGKVTSADDSITIPTHTPPLLSPGASYGLTLRIWDDVARESTPNDPVYTDTSTTFTFDLSSDVDPVTALAVTVVDGEPVATATWTDTVAPDSLTVVVDGVTYAVGIDPSDAHVSGTSYAWPLHVKPRTEHSVSVLRVVNGETSDDNDTETFTTTPTGVWLSTLDGLHSVGLEGTDVKLQASELSAVRKPLGLGTNPVLITQAVYLPEGDAQLNISAYSGTTLAEAEAEWDAITNRDLYAAGTPISITLSDSVKRVFIYNVFKDVKADEFDKIPVSFSLCELR